MLVLSINWIIRIIQIIIFLIVFILLLIVDIYWFTNYIIFYFFSVLSILSIYITLVAEIKKTISNNIFYAQKIFYFVWTKNQDRLIIIAIIE